MDQRRTKPADSDSLPTHNYTVFVRLPFARNDFVDPPQVSGRHILSPLVQLVYGMAEFLARSTGAPIMITSSGILFHGRRRASR